MECTATKNRRDRIRFAGFVVRLCVVFCLWQGPVPWLHCHETDLASPASIVELSHHLAKFHSITLLDRNHDYGWHFHWILPGWSDEFHELSDDGSPAKAFFDLIDFFWKTPASIDGLLIGDLCHHPSANKHIDTRRIIWKIERCQLQPRKHELANIMRC